MYDPALSFWSINSTGLLHPSCRPLWPPRISSAALAERLLWLGVEVRGWWDLLLMLWCVVNTFNYCCHCSWWLNGLPMGVPLGFMISETNGGPFEVIGIYIYIIEGSLEVKLPTIWRDGKAEVGRVREKKIRDGEDQRGRKSEERRLRCAKR